MGLFGFLFGSSPAGGGDQAQAASNFQLHAASQINAINQQYEAFTQYELLTSVGAVGTYSLRDSSTYQPAAETLSRFEDALRAEVGVAHPDVIDVEFTVIPTPVAIEDRRGE